MSVDFTADNLLILFSVSFLHQYLNHTVKIPIEAINKSYTSFQVTRINRRMQRIFLLVCCNFSVHLSANRNHQSFRMLSGHQVILRLSAFLSVLIRKHRNSVKKW